MWRTQWSHAAREMALPTQHSHPPLRLALSAPEEGLYRPLHDQFMRQVPHLNITLVLDAASHAMP